MAFCQRSLERERRGYFKRSFAGSGNCSSLEEVAHCLELLASCVSVFWVGKGRSLALTCWLTGMH